MYILYAFICGYMCIYVYNIRAWCVCVSMCIHTYKTFKTQFLHLVYHLTQILKELVLD